MGRESVFAEFDGHVVQYELQPGQQIVVDTGHLAAMETTCTMEIKNVPGVKNMLFGGEGLFNTVISGPGKVWLADHADQQCGGGFKTLSSLWFII